MTVAVAKAIMLSRQECFEKGENKGKGFQAILVEVMQDFGRRLTMKRLPFLLGRRR